MTDKQHHALVQTDRLAMQTMVDFMFTLTIALHSNQTFLADSNRDQIGEWTAKQVEGALGIKTAPLGMSWGVIQEVK